MELHRQLPFKFHLNNRKVVQQQKARMKRQHLVSWQFRKKRRRVWTQEGLQSQLNLILILV
jgi:hypothetical protein